MSLFRKLEEMIDFNFHVLTPKELGLINYGLIGMSQKRCSLDLRRKIRNYFLKIEFKSISPYDLLIIWTSFKREYNNKNIHYKLFDFFDQNYEHLVSTFDNFPKLPLHILSTYAFNHLESRFRKVTKRKDEVAHEKLVLNQKYSKHILEYFDAYDLDDIQ